MAEHSVSNIGEFIAVKVKFFATFKRITNQKEIELQLEEGTTIAQLMDILIKLYIDLKKEIFDDNSKIKDYIQILKNGRNIKYLNALNTQLKDADTISIFPPVAGG